MRVSPFVISWKTRLPQNMWDLPSFDFHFCICHMFVSCLFVVSRLAGGLVVALLVLSKMDANAYALW